MIVKANKTTKGSASDKVMTPYNIAKILVQKLPISENDILLEPCRGTGNFYINFPQKNKKYFCEIDDGIDFFQFEKKVDWIITNPPYSIYDKFVEHCFELSENVCLLIPFSKIATSFKRIKQIKDYGGVNKIWFIGAGKCGFPFGFPCSFIWIKKGIVNNDYEVIKEGM